MPRSIDVIRAADPSRPPTPGPESTDAELAVATRDGDPHALAALYGRYAHALMGVAYRLLASREDAEDVVHDVFVGLPEALRKYDERGRLESWLKRVTVRVALSRMRTERAERGSDVRAADLSGPSGLPPEDRITLAAAVATLAPSLRAVLVLKEVEGFTHAEIGAMLGISRGASEVRLHRALAALRTTMTKEGGGE
jgi:RNA polymerase sigma-70 factor (ECF subfamily)